MFLVVPPDRAGILRPAPCIAGLGRLLKEAGSRPVPKTAGSCTCLPIAVPLHLTSRPPALTRKPLSNPTGPGNADSPPLFPACPDSHDPASCPAAFDRGCGAGPRGSGSAPRFRSCPVQQNEAKPVSAPALAARLHQDPYHTKPATTQVLLPSCPAVRPIG